MASNRSHSTPHALRCNCNERFDPRCKYTHRPNGPYLVGHIARPLDIDPRPECNVCHEPYLPGDGLYGTCRTCRAIPLQERHANVSLIGEWLGVAEVCTCDRYPDGKLKSLADTSRCPIADHRALSL